MAAKQYFAICDTETTIGDTVADFALVICDRKGNIFDSFACLIQGEFDAKELFYIPNITGDWSLNYAREKREVYNRMLNDGKRYLASVSAVNNHIVQMLAQYNPTLTAYNLPFDVNACKRTGIDLIFNESFCLWAAASGNICQRKSYRQFCLDNHLFNAPTEYRNMTYKTNAEAVAGYLAGEYHDEPHTALEDAIDFELPILVEVLSRRNWKEKAAPYNYRAFQVKDCYTAKGTQ